MKPLMNNKRAMHARDPREAMEQDANEGQETQAQEHAEMLNGAQDLKEQSEALLKQAVALLYGEHYQQLVNLFKSGGVEGFPNAIATSINTVIQSLEQQAPIAPEVAAAVGSKLFFMLLEDVVKGELLPKLPVEVIKQGLGQTIAMYAKTHPEQVTEQDMQRLVAEINQREQGVM